MNIFKSFSFSRSGAGADPKYRLRLRLLNVGQGYAGYQESNCGIAAAVFSSDLFYRAKFLMRKKLS